jgi:hypothetical protein
MEKQKAMKYYLINLTLFIFGIFLILSSGCGGYIIDNCTQPGMAIIGGIFCVVGIMFQFIWGGIFWILDKLKKKE